MIGKELHRGLEREDVAAIIEAHDWLAGLADRDCDCQWNSDESQLDNPCDSCQARRAMDALNLVIDPKPRTMHPSRLKNDAERVYFELWCKDNERHRHVNGGYTLIEHLLHPENGRTHGLDKRPAPFPVTQHDMTIATTIIQWLGTTCGRCFMDKAEKEIERRRSERNAFGTQGISMPPKAWKDRDENGPMWSVADSIAAQFVSVAKSRSVYVALRGAIHNALCEFAKEPASQPIT